MPSLQRLNRWRAPIGRMSPGRWARRRSSAVCMLLAPRIHSALPGSLIGIVIVTVLASVVSAPLDVIGALPSTIPVPRTARHRHRHARRPRRAGPHGRGARGHRVAALGAGRRLARRHRSLRSRPRARRSGSRVDRLWPVRRNAGDGSDRAHRGERALGWAHADRRALPLGCAAARRARRRGTGRPHPARRTRRRAHGHGCAHGAPRHHALGAPIDALRCSRVHPDRRDHRVVRPDRRRRHRRGVRRRLRAAQPVARHRGAS